MPLSLLDAHFRSFEKNVVPVLLKRNTGVIAMKTMASGQLLRATSATPREALEYVWSLPVSTIVSGMDSMELLQANAKVARTFKPLSQEAKRLLLDKTREPAADGKHEPFKTTRNFDGPVGRRIHGIS